MLRNPFRDLDQKKLRHSSELMRKQNDFNKITNQRIKILALVIVMIFVALGFQVFRIQILSQEEYQEKLVEYSSPTQVTTPPRGQIYDRNNVVIAQTLSSNNITYFPPEEISGNSEEIWQMAIRFSMAFDVSYDDLKEIDFKDMYIFLHRNESGRKDQAVNLVSEEERSEINQKENADTLLTNTIRSRITSDMIEEATQSEAERMNQLNEEENLGLDTIEKEDIRRAWKCYQAMVKAPSTEIKTVLENVSNEQVAYLIEHKSEFKGFDIDFGSWKREYPYESTFRDVLGKVTSNSQGLPAELKDYYLGLGYSLNEQIGESGLERQYEDLLNGTRNENEVKYNEDGVAVFNEIVTGKKGYDLQLSIDIELQKKIDEILTKVLEDASKRSNQQDFKKAYVTLMNPKTGEIYAMSGMQNTDDGIVNFASGNYKDTFTPGSVVKPATLYMGLNEGVVTADEVINDTPMYIQGTAPKASYHNYGPITAYQAIAKSSNIYMFHIAIRLGGATYIENGPLGISDVTGTFALMRSYYSMFGLGSITGLDVPDEVSGNTGFSTAAGNLLDYAIGQFDNYTPMQLAQYAATLANDGVKVKPRLVKQAFEINSREVVYENKAEVLSVLNGDLTHLKTVQEGMRSCVRDESCGIRDVGADMAAKTGTAEVIVMRDGEAINSTNASLIGYGPYEDPTVAFACVTPNSSDASDLQTNPCSTDIMPAVLEEFFKKY